MGVIPDASAFLFTALGALLFWGVSLIKEWWKHSTAKRREEVDEMATLRRKNRQLTESLHAHRIEMINSGRWDWDTMPPFIKEYKE